MSPKYEECFLQRNNMISLHADAIKNYNNKAKSLIDLFKPYVPPEQNPTQTEHYISAKLTEKDLLNIPRHHYLVNQIGENVCLVNSEKEGMSILDEKSFTILRDLSQKIASLKGTKRYLSNTFIQNTLCEWLSLCRNRETADEFIKFMITKSEASIRVREVWIPIPFTSTQQNFRFGNVDFKTITEKTITQWFLPKDEKIVPKQNKEDIDVFILKMREEIQGFMAGVIKLEAEPIKAKEIAFDEVSNSISLLRLFAPANFNPELIVGAYEYGWKNYDSEKCLIFTDVDKGTKFQMTEAVRDKGLHWIISEKIIHFLEQEENINFNILLTMDKRNKFQDDILNSILIYSRHTLKRDISDKLMYILVSLESVLLKNETEPIQQNLSERIAFLIAQNAESRKSISKKIKNIYHIRSQFIHHGKPTNNDMDVIREFFNISWSVFKMIIRNMDRFESKDEFLSEIDMIKYA